MPKKDDIFSQDLIEQRTKEYSKEEEQIEVKEEIKEYLGFRLGSEWYLVDMHYVEEIVKPARISPLPRQKSFVLGVMNIRGDIILNVDLRQLLTQTATDLHEHSRIIFVKSQTDTTGFLADEVIGVQKLDTGDFQIGIATIQGEHGEFTEGLYNKDNRHFVWLNMERILSKIGERLAK